MSDRHQPGTLIGIVRNPQRGLKQACAVASENSGVEFLIDDSRVSEKSLADSESRIYEARIYFKSFYGEEDARIRVNLDVKEYDRIFLQIQPRRLIHSYSDAALCQGDMRCLKLEELLASKLKALLQRRHSPDLYDFVHAVFFQKALNISRREVLSTFLKQTIYEPEPMVARNLLLELPFPCDTGVLERIPRMSEIVSLQLRRRRGLVQDRRR